MGVATFAKSSRKAWPAPAEDAKSSDSKITEFLYLLGEVDCVMVGFGATMTAPAATGGFSPPGFGGLGAGFGATGGAARAEFAGAAAVDSDFEFEEGPVVTFLAPDEGPPGLKELVLEGGTGDVAGDASVGMFVEPAGAPPGTEPPGEVCPICGLVEEFDDAGGFVGV
jgi:hypothetical protein